MDGIEEAPEEADTLPLTLPRAAQRDRSVWAAQVLVELESGSEYLQTLGARERAPQKLVDDLQSLPMRNGSLQNGKRKAVDSPQSETGEQ